MEDEQETIPDVEDVEQSYMDDQADQGEYQ
jgi:hypothetical protein